MDGLTSNVHYDLLSIPSMDSKTQRTVVPPLPEIQPQLSDEDDDEDNQNNNDEDGGNYYDTTYYDVETGEPTNENQVEQYR